MMRVNIISRSTVSHHGELLQSVSIKSLKGSWSCRFVVCTVTFNKHRHKLSQIAAVQSLFSCS
ncbi:hypothetical protein M758_2G189200 [Ceratodon purpureus]|nr:hypothetical protein M758_2G189200 [Ceratodon purpureus]